MMKAEKRGSSEQEGLATKERKEHKVRKMQIKKIKTINWKNLLGIEKQWGGRF